MPYNFHAHDSKKHWREILLFLILIWILIFRNVYLIHDLEYIQSTPKKTNLKKSFPIITLCEALAKLPAGVCVIHKIDIFSHQMFLYGQASAEEDLGRLIQYFNQVHHVLKVEVIQWDFIKSGHWRFIVSLVY